MQHTEVFPIRQLQEIEQPGYTALDSQIAEIQRACDFCVQQAFTHRTIDRTQDACSFPKDLHIPPSSLPQRAVKHDDATSGSRYYFLLGCGARSAVTRLRRFAAHPPSVRLSRV